MPDDSSNRADGTEDASFSTRRRELSKELSDELGEEAMRRTGLTTRRGAMDELDIHLLTNLEERHDRLYAILSKTTPIGTFWAARSRSSVREVPRR